MRTAKTIGIYFISIFFIFMFSTKWNFDNSNAFETIATFLSIIIGFTITALSIIATSPFSKNLFSIEESTDNSKTLLHVLVNEFTHSTIIFVSTIILIVLYHFLPLKEFDTISFQNYTTSFPAIIKAFIWYLTGLSFFMFIRLFYTFSKFIIKSASA